MKWIELGLAAALGALSLYELIDRLRRRIIPDQIYTAEEAAALLRVDADTVEHLIRTGLVAAQTLNGQHRILGRVLIDYLSRPAPVVHIPVEQS